MTLAAVSLDDKYTLERGRIYLTGVQALVRLPMIQRQRDEAAGLNTGCFISGYRGSPLGGFDQQLWKARKFLKNNHIEFQPGVNEELAATAVWGSQQVNLFKDALYDGVFSIWYGKGPGVDRSGDVFKHGNMAGSSRNGGVLVLTGDDHACKSSTLPHQSEYACMDAMLPVLNPAGVQEVIDYGLIGWAMSRYSGCWVAIKCIADTMDSSASIDIDPSRLNLVLPDDFAMPEGGLNIRWPDEPMEQEYRHQRHKLYAALAFARANKLDKIVIDSPKPRFGIVSTGKSYLDVRQALDELGIGEDEAAAMGLRVYKVGMPWPLEREGMRHFAEGLEEILVVEEKRAVIENQLKEQLYNWREDVRPRVIGKFDEQRNWILPSAGELSPSQVAKVIAERILCYHDSPKLREAVAYLEAKEKAQAAPAHGFKRTPYFCSGCPHNTSTQVPEGSRAMAGIGCHYMSQWMDRSTETFTQMGGEGVPWVGQAPFTATKHIFANLGDGTYNHSGSLAIRAAVASGVSMTYKILYNDAVAMTGGQPADSAFTVDQIARQVLAEGVSAVRIVTDDPEKYPLNAFPAEATISHRDDLDSVQRELRELSGVTVLIYDQTCAAEKRRRRKRKLMVDPPKRVFINEQVCEGCGDCGVKSNCVSVVPVETEYGRKRKIDQSSCNKDYSCLKGFCPSFVGVIGGKVRKQAGKAAEPAGSPPGPRPVFGDLPDPVLPALDRPYGIMVGGIGGTGVVTIGALIGMAAHLEGKGVSVLDMAGLAQKGGQVLSHVRLAANPQDLHAARIARGAADLLLGCDLVVAASNEAVLTLDPKRSHVVANTQEVMTGDFTRNPNMAFPGSKLQSTLVEAAGADRVDFVAASKLATAALGDSIASNLFMLGFAWQKGLVPVSAEALDKAIELNGVAIEFNRDAFLWGRRAAHDLATVERILQPAAGSGADKADPQRHIAETLDGMVEKRVAYLTAYQDAAYGERYKALVAKVRAAEQAKAPGRSGLAEAVARYYHKLLAIKDEYEVARLYTDGTFLKQLRSQFEGDYKLEFHLAPPLLAERDPTSGHLKKRTYGPWMLKAFGLLARFKGLRGTALDIFGRTEERRMERRLIAEYEALIDELLAGLSAENHGIAVALAGLPDKIRGYGHVKEANLAKAKAEEKQLLAAFRDPHIPAQAAE
ncbi:indolepyruvate ferredoxin oxidoreductase family protein [Oceanibaculum pacificum]|uniref:Indolepyruvate ferredoxin oxidoreductase n=1 Tax=Oceanibaculum pacificum TaxID=580166 RepID=A0A154WF43_9PROT|nr:indolepyruvate ferredoxin oxidoreductase family protein [Oceanibaculum pacificum]KZD12153.1 indolepyruvate ferredoxin oxidoreductase [Oceanibaculum pacificum]